VLLGEHTADLAGASVAPAGDVNGDGRADVIVGAPLADPRGRPDAGSAYVVFGGGPRGRLRLGALGARGFRIDGAVSPWSGGTLWSSGAGQVVSGAGDVNGDGLSDVLVSGLAASRPPTSVFVVFGKRDTNAVDLASLGTGGYVIRSDQDFVNHVIGSPAGDVNGDGRADIAIAIDTWGDEYAGSVEVVYGKADGAPVDLWQPLLESPTWGFRVTGGTPGLILGSAVAAGGDVNGDGLGDLLIGASGAGTVFVLYGRRAGAREILLRPRESSLGSPPGEPFDGFEVAGPHGSDGFGSALARFGRGFVSSAPGSPISLGGSPRLQGRGGAWIVPSRRARPIRLPGPRTGGPAGVAVDVPGDVNGDGRREVLVLARGTLSAGATASLFSATGRLMTTYYGLRNARGTLSAAAGAGDMGGDRRADLIFGSPGTSTAYVLTSRPR